MWPIRMVGSALKRVLSLITLLFDPTVFPIIFAISIVTTFGCYIFWHLINIIIEVLKFMTVIVIDQPLIWRSLTIGLACVVLAIVVQFVNRLVHYTQKEPRQ